MIQYIDKAVVVAEIERLHKAHSGKYERDEAALILEDLEDFLDTLDAKDLYEQCVQYDSIKAGIQAHAEEYSFNIESELFNQLTKEQQKLWRKEIEQACISGGEMGVELIRDARYKEDLEAKEVDIEKEIQNYMTLHHLHIKDGGRIVFENGDSPNFMCDMRDIAKHFFELGLSVNNPTTASDRGTAEEIIVNLKRVEQDYHINLTNEMEWLRNKVKKGE